MSELVSVVLDDHAEEVFSSWEATRRLCRTPGPETADERLEWEAAFMLLGSGGSLDLLHAAIRRLRVIYGK